MIDIDYIVTGDTDVLAGLDRMEHAGGPAQAAVVQPLGTDYLTALEAASPLGRGQNPGGLIEAYEHEFRASDTSAEFTIINDKPYLRYVLNGRPAVQAKNGKYLHFWIDGREFFRRRVGPAAPNRFDERVAARMQGAIDAAPERIATIIVREYGA